MTRLNRFAAAIAGLTLVFAAAGCGAPEPEGPMPGDKVGLGNYTPDADKQADAKAASPAPGTPAKTDPASTDPARTPTQAESRTTLGYTPDASGAAQGSGGTAGS